MHFAGAATWNSLCQQCSTWNSLETVCVNSVALQTICVDSVAPETVCVNSVAPETACVNSVAPETACVNSVALKRSVSTVLHLKRSVALCLHPVFVNITLSWCQQSLNYNSSCLAFKAWIIDTSQLHYSVLWSEPMKCQYTASCLLARNTTSHSTDSARTNNQASTFSLTPSPSNNHNQILLLM